MPKVIRKEPATESDNLVARVKYFLSLKKKIDSLSKEQNEIKTELSTLVEEQGEPDEKGHIWYRLPKEVEGVVSLQRQRRVSQKLDEEVAESILKEKGLASRCYKLVPVLDEAEVMSCLYENLLTEDEIDSMFPKSVSYAFVTSKS